MQDIDLSNTPTTDALEQLLADCLTEINETQSECAQRIEVLMQEASEYVNKLNTLGFLKH